MSFCNESDILHVAPIPLRAAHSIKSMHHARDTLWSIGPSGAVFTRMKISMFSELLVVRKGSLKRCWRFLRMMIYLPSWAHRVGYLTLCTSHCGILGVANPLVQEHWCGISMLSLLTVSTSWSFSC